MATFEIHVSSKKYEDADNCLAAAADDYKRRHRLAGWDLFPRWGDETTRETIILTVPGVAKQKRV
jgi:hypothetical protein